MKNEKNEGENTGGKVLYQKLIYITTFCSGGKNNNSGLIFKCSEQYQLI
jgi:hypothetical protein